MLNLQPVRSQTDFPLSRLTSSPAQLNPASTGLFGDLFRVHSYFKSQMHQSLEGGIKGVGAAVDYNLFDWKMGVGLMVYSNSVDRSALRDFNLLVSYGYRVELNRWSLLSFGLQTGLKQVGFSLESLSFGSQYDPAYKGGFDPSKMPSYSIPTNINNFDVSVGGYWQGYLGPFFALNVGAAAFHLSPMKTDFLTDETHLRPKYVLSVNARYETYYLHWIPSAMFVTQSDRSYVETGMVAQFRQTDKFVNAGVYFRTPNVMVPTVGIGFDKLSVNLSIEYYLKNNFSNIFNIGISYFPQTNQKASLIQDYIDI
ncbi:MAG: type IX secretion system membrane protein PorP/SprF [Bacteroidales bacterium]|nr:type IX secretion system membrane protein PorP/SprF [Bacteroidales bacterium]